MTIACSDPIRQPDINSNIWPNTETKIRGLAFLVNTCIAIQRLSFSPPINNKAVIVINLLIRFSGVKNHIQNREYLKVALDVCAFTTLFFPPQGLYISMGIDAIAELFNCYSNREKKENPLLPIKIKKVETFKEACDYLGIPQDKRDDLAYIESKFSKMAAHARWKLARSRKHGGLSEAGWELINAEFDQSIKLIRKELNVQRSRPLEFYVSKFISLFR